MSRCLLVRKNEPSALVISEDVARVAAEEEVVALQVFVVYEPVAPSRCL
jgi:hypothetical protein